MNRILLSIALVLASLTTLTANPAINLDEWGAGETAPAELIQNNTLILPAGTQLYRNVTGGAVTLQITSTPTFSSDPEEVALLEIGSNALALSQTAGTGHLILLPGDLKPQTLSYAIALDENDRPTEPLNLSLTQRGSALFLTLQGQTQRIATDPLPENTQIVLSTGARHDWRIQTLILTTEPLIITEEENPVGSGGSSSSNTPDPTSKGTSGNSPSANSGTSASDTSATTGDSASSDVQKNHRPVRLEVFTPPAVRRGRSAAVRAALAQAQLN